uniref:Uncharacterized protein n=1 Tax=Glossina pallidipes TaxID=7398 RepID=A0A1B0ABJ7_GLOPL
MAQPSKRLKSLSQIKDRSRFPSKPGLSKGMTTRQPCTLPEKCSMSAPQYKKIPCSPNRRNKAKKVVSLFELFLPYKTLCQKQFRVYNINVVTAQLRLSGSFSFLKVTAFTIDNRQPVCLRFRFSNDLVYDLIDPSAKRSPLVSSDYDVEVVDFQLQDYTTGLVLKKK